MATPRALALVTILSLGACGDDPASTTPDGGDGDGGNADAEVANPAAGTLDPSWGTNGLAIVSNGNPVTLTCMVEQSTGRLVMVGETSAGLYNGFGWQSIDAGGAVPIEPLYTARVGGGTGDVHHCSATADDEIYIAGTDTSGGAGTTYAVVQKLVGTAQDTTFGPSGQVATLLGLGIDNGSVGFAAVEQADGTVLLAGGLRGYMQTDVRNFYLYRFTATGDRDTTFGPNLDGRAFADAGAIAAARVPVTLADGSIIAVGTINGAVAAMRFSAAGVQDTSFGAAGVRASTVQVDTLAPAPGGVIGLANRFNTVTLIRTDLQGALDPAFGRDGVVEPAVPATFFATDVVVQPNGKLLLTGQVGASPALTVLRLLPSGELDPSFNGTGRADFDVGAALTGARAHRLLLARDGGLLVGGIGTKLGNASPQWFALKVQL